MGPFLEHSLAPRMHRCCEASPTTCRFGRRCWRCRGHLARLLLRFLREVWFCWKETSEVKISNLYISSAQHFLVCFLPVAYMGPEKTCEQNLNPLFLTQYLPEGCLKRYSFPQHFLSKPRFISMILKLRPPAHHEWTIVYSMLRVSKDPSLLFNQFWVPVVTFPATKKT